ncbi:MAG: 6-bladed beta-propeller [Planctomycetaceae bacterium]|nr:6-bladed beta-propeller [Planctomycetaceae bacterium]
MIRSLALALTAFLTFAAAGIAADQQPVRMGSGLMTFDTVPGWGLDENGVSVLGPTHGGVVVDKAGNIYTSAKIGVFCFSPDGKVIRRFLGDEYTQMHDMKISDEAEGEFIYAARNEAGEGIKFRADTGEIVLKLAIPQESGLKLEKWAPTAITVGPNGDIFLSDGYASDHIFKFDKTGKYLMHFGVKGDGLRQFHTAHGMTLDTRYDPPRILVCDRNHLDDHNNNRGRLLHYSLDGEFIDVIASGLGMPTSAIVQGDYVSVPDLHGRLWILNKENVIMAVLGFNPDPAKGHSFGIEQKDWVEGVFSGTHGSAWDAEGNLYVQDWNTAGRLIKLVRVK